MGKPAKKIIKEIKVDLGKCNGCRACEKACAAFHAIPRYSNFNPARSRIKVVIDERNDQWVPVRAGGYTQAECSGRNLYVIEGKEYSECALCPASCPSRPWFKEPDSGLPLKCDMCEDVPPLSEPMCVQMCARDCLTYVEREVESAEEETREAENQTELKTAYEALVKKHGQKKVVETFGRLSHR
ncbi:MAG: (4Fe-4S)-binding protein [Desulfobacteraceae bacterium 4572_87]|nr:MAG: (4Fe-4S)-binding protein [Desulfobacteraceae bacterium 4572_87]